MRSEKLKNSTVTRSGLLSIYDKEHSSAVVAALFVHYVILIIILSLCCTVGTRSLLHLIKINLITIIRLSMFDIG